jgi:hypothetical protein
MKQVLGYLLSSIIILSFISCNGDYRSVADGNAREAVVVMDSTMWDSETADAIRDVFGGFVYTVPSNETFYDLQFTQIRSQSHLERLRNNKNVIFAAPIDEDSNTGRQIRAFLDESIVQRVRDDESFAFPVEDHWYKDQYVLILTSTSDSALAQKIRNTEESLLDNMLDKELRRWEYFVYEKMELTHFSDSLWENKGFKVRFQHDYRIGIDTLNFQSYRRALPENDRWMWIWYKDGVEDPSFITADWINATRDSLNEHFIKGAREETMHVSTYYGNSESRPVITDTFDHGRLIAYETLGTWHMVGVGMGVPFVNFTYYDPDTNRLFMIEYSQFAPSVRRKLPFVRQFRAMGRTFESDSTWVSDKEEPAS